MIKEREERRERRERRVEKSEKKRKRTNSNILSDWIQVITQFIYLKKPTRMGMQMSFWHVSDNRKC